MAALLDGEQQKLVAARAAAALVQDGQIVGLGTGSTAELLVQALAERARQGLRFIGVPTSEATASLATVLGLRLMSLDDCPRLDLDIDGADEVDPALNLVKGRGGAFLREKLVASAANRFIVIVDEGKLVEHLGERTSVPVEVIRFGWTHTFAALRLLSAGATLRGGDEPFRTDEGHYVVDCHFVELRNPKQMADQIKGLPGVVEHGFFLGLASMVLVGRADGGVTRLVR